MSAHSQVRNALLRKGCVKRGTCARKRTAALAVAVAHGSSVELPVCPVVHCDCACLCASVLLCILCLSSLSEVGGGGKSAGTKTRYLSGGKPSLPSSTGQCLLRNDDRFPRTWWLLVRSFLFFPFLCLPPFFLCKYFFPLRAYLPAAFGGGGGDCGGSGSIFCAIRLANQRKDLARKKKERRVRRDH